MTFLPAPAAQALRFNRSTAAKLMRTENLGRPIAAASNALGTGAPCTLFDLYVLDRVLLGEGEEKIEDWVSSLGANLDAEGRGKLRDVLGRGVAIPETLPPPSGVWFGSLAMVISLSESYT